MYRVLRQENITYVSCLFVAAYTPLEVSGHSMQTDNITGAWFGWLVVSNYRGVNNNITHMDCEYFSSISLTLWVLRMNVCMA